MLLLQGCLRQLPLKDQSPLLVNISFHPSKSVGANEREINSQAFILLFLVVLRGARLLAYSDLPFGHHWLPVCIPDVGWQVGQGPTLLP